MLCNQRLNLAAQIATRLQQRLGGSVKLILVDLELGLRERQRRLQRTGLIGPCLRERCRQLLGLQVVIDQLLRGVVQALLRGLGEWSDWRRAVGCRTQGISESKVQQVVGGQHRFLRQSLLLAGSGQRLQPHRSV